MKQKKSSTTKDGNALDLLPRRCCEWKKESDGHICLQVPRFRNAWIRRLAMRLGKSENVNTHLDETGTRVWELIDGERRIEEIGREMEEKDGESVQQKYERLTTFMMILEKNSFIQFQRD